MKDITLCCIDCVNQPLAIRALRRSMPALPFAQILLLTNGTYDLPDLQVQYIPALQSHAEYSHFVAKALVAHVHTSHVLLVQWDGYIVNPSAWTEEFLQYDYIGAPWGFHRDAYRVGNGGFSLRSKRLLEALRDPEIAEIHPEDVAICRQYRPLLEQRYGIRFAPETVAEQFSFESTIPRNVPFGFHALHNMWVCLKPEELHDFLMLLTPDIVASRQCLLLARNFLEKGRQAEAVAVLQRRLQVLPGDTQTLVLLKHATSLSQKYISMLREKIDTFGRRHPFFPWLTRRQGTRREDEP